MSAHSITMKLAFFYLLITTLLAVAIISILHYSLGLFVTNINESYARYETGVIERIIKASPDKERIYQNLVLKVFEQPADRDSKFYLFRIMDEDNRTLFQSPGMYTVLPPSAFTRNTNYITLAKKHNSHQDMHTYYLSSSHLFHLGHSWVIQIAIDSSDSSRFIISYFKFSWVAFVLVILFFMFLGIYVIKRVLKPLVELNASLPSLTFDNMENRFEVADWPVELQSIVASLNGMLDKINKSFEQLKGFSSELAHELRTPINSMICQIEVCLKVKGNSEELVFSLLDECRSMKKMVDDILFISKSTRGTEVVSYETITLGKLFASLNDYIKMMSEEKNIDVAFEGDAVIQANEELLKRLFLNLIHNSICYSAADTRVLVRINERDRFVTIDVVDQGKGISKDNLPFVFERFYRADIGTSEGTGIGLAIVKAIVDLHNGMIDIKSSLGQGTTVSVQLPIAQNNTN